MADKKDDPREQRLRAALEKIKDARARVEKSIEAMRGREDAASTNRRKAAHAAIEKLKEQEEQVREKLRAVRDDKGKNSEEIASLEERVRDLSDRMEKRGKIIADKVGALREHIKVAVGDNPLLAKLMEKERLSMRVKFDERLLASGSLSADDKDEVASRVAKEKAMLAKAEKVVDDAIDDINADYEDSDSVKAATQEAEGSAKELTKDEKELADLRSKLESADESAHDKIQGDIDSLQEKIAKKDSKAKEAKLEIAALEDQLGFARGKKDTNAQEMLQKILDNKKAALKKLEDE